MFGCSIASPLNTLFFIFINKEKEAKNMKFIDFLLEKEPEKEPEQEQKKKKVKTTAENSLRDAEIKIKSKIPTSFGTEFILARKYPTSEIKDALQDFKFEIKGNSVFVFSL
jgi:hypothetical protein